MAGLQERVEELFERPREELGEEAREAFAELRERLNRGEVRAAEERDGTWSANPWVKKGILLGFRIGEVRRYEGAGQGFLDKDTLPLRRLDPDDGVRVVPGGSAIRDGAYLGPGVVCMPPMYVNIGAYVGEGTMIDSHALVGSCAQVGVRVHLSAGAQVGGVLEPVGSLPVILEDDVFVGGNCGIYEGTVVREGAILGAGTVLTASLPVFDLVREEVLRAVEGRPLEIPANAVVVPGSRAVREGWGREQGLSLYAPVIVKYRDRDTEAAVRLEDLLR